jgi:hypothetical protein
MRFNFANLRFKRWPKINQYSHSRKRILDLLYVALIIVSLSYSHYCRCYGNFNSIINMGRYRRRFMIDLNQMMGNDAMCT